MNLDQIRQSDKAFLIPADIAPVLGCDPYTLCVQAHQDAAKLGFPVCIMGRRVRIPRLAFLRWMEGGAPDESAAETSG